MGAFSVQKFKEVETKNQAAMPKPQSSPSTDRVEAKPFAPKVTQAAKLQWRLKPLKLVTSQTEEEASPQEPSTVLATSTSEPVFEVPLSHLPGLADTFNVAAVRQQMLADSEQDIPLDEPGLDLETEDDLEEEGNLDATDVPSSECSMVYVLPAKYALPDPANSC